MTEPSRREDSRAEAHTRRLNERYQRLHTAKEDAFWVAYMGLADDADGARKELETKETELGRFLQDPEQLAATRHALEEARATGAPADVLTSLEGWVRTFEAHVIDSVEGRALAEEITELEGVIARARGQMALGYDKPGVGMTPASSVELGVLVATHPDEATRRAAWEGLRSIEPLVLARGFLELVKKRNRLGRLLGAEDFYDWRTRRVEGMPKAEIFALLDELEHNTRGAAQRAREALRGERGPGATRPHNFGFHVAGAVTARQDPYFPFSAALHRWGRAFAALGVKYRDAELVLDLVDRKGKYENGFMHGPVVAWREGEVFHPARIHFTANAIPGLRGSGERAIKTLFHEGGHAAHFANIDMPAPCFGQEFAPTSVAFAETQSMFMDSMLNDADWLSRYAETEAGEPMPSELMEEGIRSTQPFAAASVRGMLAVCYGERAIYEIPDAELDAERVLGAIRDAERQMTFEEEGSGRPVLSVPHLLAGESSAYYHGYVLALMAVHQTRRYFLARDGHLVDNPAIGPELTRAYWQPGNSKTFPRFVEALTGESPSALALSEDVTASVEDKLVASRRAVERLSEVPRFVGDVALEATVRLVHGREQIADTSDGFEAAAAAYGEWIKARERERAS